MEHKKIRGFKDKMKIAIVLIFIIFFIFILSFIMDNWILIFVESSRNIVLDYFFVLIELLSRPLIVFLFFMTLFLYKKEYVKNINPLILTALITLLISFVLKILIKRDFPFYNGIVSIAFFSADFIKSNISLWNYSFPSFQTMLVFSIIPILSREFNKFNKYFLIFSLLVGFSRIYFGINYLSDIIFSGFLGYLIGHIIIFYTDKFRIKRFLKDIK